MTDYHITTVNFQFPIFYKMGKIIRTVLFPTTMCDCFSLQNSPNPKIRFRSAVFAASAIYTRFTDVYLIHAPAAQMLCIFFVYCINPIS